MNQLQEVRNKYVENCFYDQFQLPVIYNILEDLKKGMLRSLKSFEKFLTYYLRETDEVNWQEIFQILKPVSISFEEFLQGFLVASVEANSIAALLQSFVKANNNEIIFLQNNQFIVLTLNGEVATLFKATDDAIIEANVVDKLQLIFHYEKFLQNYLTALFCRLINLQIDHIEHIFDNEVVAYTRNAEKVIFAKLVIVIDEINSHDDWKISFYLKEPFLENKIEIDLTWYRRFSDVYDNIYVNNCKLDLMNPKHLQSLLDGEIETSAGSFPWILFNIVDEIAKAFLGISSKVSAKEKQRKKFFLRIWDYDSIIVFCDDLLEHDLSEPIASYYRQPD